MIYSYITKRIEDGGWTGVCRFDSYLRRVFPELQSVTPSMLPDLVFTRDDVVITDNHLSLDIRPDVPTIVVHHGCAQTHYERDVAWQSPRTETWCQQQREMFTKPNRIYVAPSGWVRGEFVRHYGLPEDYARVIVNWVPDIDEVPPEEFDRDVVVIGDWRDSNKGSGAWQQIAKELPHFSFKPLRFSTDEDRVRTYQQADVYLCLSLSEGGAYSVCDAEAAGLDLVTTEVGNYQEFTEARTIPFPEKQQDIEAIASTLWDVAYYGGREESYYDEYTFEVWSDLWWGAVEDVRDGAGPYL